ncbi:unnamed protein product [Darwinula stevensoni]|uniref:Uncharacterized protein n=1 Tax=Darwinula stevensoni TaxID=69355 RepID=A0A7R8XCK7_9CRUS|nr:unnamed protein product [Darwinula stevensoni]CAG0893869.1 unnamed protein product [Darwinula stevensoni]
MRNEMWIAMFLAGTVVTIYCTYLVVVDYLSYPVITYVSMSHARKMAFPAVTVCNSNPIVCYKLGQLRDLLPELWNVSGCRIEALMLVPVSWLNSSNWNAEELKNGLNGYLQEVVNTTELALTIVDQGYTYTNNLPLLNLMSGTNKNSRLDSLLKSLLYVAPVEFKARNGSRAFDVLIAYMMGKGDLTSGTTQASTNPVVVASTTSVNASSNGNGSSNVDGLRGFGVQDSKDATEDYLNEFQTNAAPTIWDMLHVQHRLESKRFNRREEDRKQNWRRNSYVRNPSASSVGARITIHSANEWPNPVEQGYIVQPNTRNVFALQVVNMSRLESPYSTDCFSDWHETEYKPYSMDNPNASLDYTQVVSKLKSIIDDTTRRVPLFYV